MKAVAPSVAPLYSGRCADRFTPAVCEGWFTPAVALSVTPEVPLALAPAVYAGRCTSCLRRCVRQFTPAMSPAVLQAVFPTVSLAVYTGYAGGCPGTLFRRLCGGSAGDGGAALTCSIRAPRACLVLACWRLCIAWQRSGDRFLLRCICAMREKGNFQLFHFVQLLKMVRFPENVNFVNSLKINVRQVACQCIHGKKNGAHLNFGSRCQATRTSTTTSNNNREERLEADLQGGKFALSTILSSATVGDSPVWTGRSLSANVPREVTLYQANDFVETSSAFPVEKDPSHIRSFSVFGREIFRLWEPGSQAAKTSIFGRLALSLRNLSTP